MPQLIVDIKEINQIIEKQIGAEYGRRVIGICYDIVPATEDRISFVKTVCITLGESLPQQRGDPNDF